SDAAVTSSAPSPGIAAIASDIIIPTNTSRGTVIACFDTTTNGNCSGSWPVSDSSGDIGNAGAPIPILTSTGTPTGFCLPPGRAIPCYSLAGASVATPPGMADNGDTRGALSAQTGSSAIWNGPAVQLGPRIYVPRWGQEVDCYDYNTQQGCPNFPKIFNNPSLNLLYTVNVDPQRPTCLWVNADSGTQIQDFDAFTGGVCGEGPIRVRADSFIVNSTPCLPGSYTSLQVTEPAPTAYQSGTVSFQDPSGNPIPKASDVPL